VPGAREAVARQRFVPAEDPVLRDHDVRPAIAGHIYEPKIWVLGIDVWEGLERSESLPTALGRALVEPRHRTVKLDKVQMAFSSEIEQLLPTCSQRSEGRLRRDPVGWAERPVTEVALIIPRVGLLGEDARQSFTVEIHPLVIGSINAVW
jgi:hypothetical protein